MLRRRYGGPRLLLLLLLQLLLLLLAQTFMPTYILSCSINYILIPHRPVCYDATTAQDDDVISGSKEHFVVR